MSKFAILIIAFTLIVLSCSKDKSEMYDDNISINVTLYDSLTLKVIDSALVRLEESHWFMEHTLFLSEYSNQKGNVVFEFNSNDVLSYRLVVRKDSYKEKVQSLNSGVDYPNLDVYLVRN